MIITSPDHDAAAFVHPLPNALEHDHGQGDADGAVGHREHLPRLRGRRRVAVACK